MAFPYTGAGSNAEKVAEQIDSLVNTALDKTSAWRAAVNSTSQVDSLQAQEAYQALASLRAYVASRSAVDGLAAAYLRRFPSLSGGFDPVAEWSAPSIAIANFGAWFQANWPKRVSITNEPAFAQYGPTGELVRFTIDLSAPAKAALLALLDAIVAAFVPK